MHNCIKAAITVNSAVVCTEIRKEKIDRTSQAFKNFTLNIFATFVLDLSMILHSFIASTGTSPPKTIVKAAVKNEDFPMLWIYV